MRRLLWCLLVGCVAFAGNVTAQEIKIGLALGYGDSIEAALREGVLQAQEDINSAGGMNGQRINVLTMFDYNDPGHSLSNAQNLHYSEGVRYVIASITGRRKFDFVQDFYKEQQVVLLLAATSTNPEFTAAENWNVVRVGRRDDAPGALTTKLLDPRSMGNSELTSKFGSPNTQDPSDYTVYQLYGYAALQVLAAGIEEVGHFDDPRATATALRNSEVNTVLGTLDFENGDVASAVLNGESKPDCPTCPRSGNCPEYVVAAKEECCKSGNCPE